MLRQYEIGKLTQLTATEGFVHKKGTETYAKSIVMLPSDTLEMYEEVDAIPPYTKAEYNAKVNELVRQRYSESEEFAIQRKMLNTVISPMTPSEDAAESAADEYATYNSFVEECKEKAPAAILEDIERRKVEEEAELERQRQEAEAENSEVEDATYTDDI